MLLKNHSISRTTCSLYTYYWLMLDLFCVQKFESLVFKECSVNRVWQFSYGKIHTVYLCIAIMTKTCTSICFQMFAFSHQDWPSLMVVEFDLQMSHLKWLWKMKQPLWKICNKQKEITNTTKRLKNDRHTCTPKGLSHMFPLAVTIGIKPEVHAKCVTLLWTARYWSFDTKRKHTLTPSPHLPDPVAVEQPSLIGRS